MATILLVFLFTACQQNRDLAPEIGAEQVRVAMGVSIPPYYTGNGSRQSGEVTQAAGTADAFRGIGQMTLLAFDGVSLPTGTSTLKVNPISLGGIAKSELTSMKNYKFFEDKPINIGVSHAVVYAEAASAEGGEVANGVMISKLNGSEATLSSLSNTNELHHITFSLKQMTAANLTDYQTKLANILNDIIDASITVQGSDECDYFSVTESQVVKRYTAGTGTPLLWKNLVGEQPVGEESADIDLDDEKLRQLFEHFSQLHSGSAASVLEAVKSLYHVLSTYTMGTHAIQWKEDGAGGYLIKSCDIDADPESTYTKLVIDRTALKDAIIAKIAAHFVITGEQVTGYNTSGLYYPGEVNLPDGSLPIRFENGHFTYADAGAILPDSKIQTTSICYPASLYYTVNSPLRTRNTELHDADKLLVNTATAWTNAQTAGGLWGSDKTGAGKEWRTSVQNDTRTIVLTENIHYAVALLETSVRVASTTLQDNNKRSDGVTPDPNLLAVPAAGFPVVGILVGSQPDCVGWDLHAATTDNGYALGTTSYTQTIYDNAGYAPVAGSYPVTAKYSTSTFSEPLRTLCLESQEWSDENENGSLYIALELKNNTGMAFVGADGVVPADGTFYLLAKLDLEADAGNGITNVNGAGIGTQLKHVLQQGYKTQARLTIASLKNAYNTIPDLRLTKLAFGLSVDLMWQQGAMFDM